MKLINYTAGILTHPVYATLDHPLFAFGGKRGIDESIQQGQLESSLTRSLLRWTTLFAFGGKEGWVINVGIFNNIKFSVARKFHYANSTLRSG
jgi:hypothetical protein